MNFDTETLNAAHQHCASHRKEIEASDSCGCFYCQEIFPPSEIEHWLEETGGELSMRPDPWTAMCPRCGIDAVIGSSSGFPVTDPTFLSAMHSRWFENNA